MFIFTNCSPYATSCADEPTVQGVRRARGWVPFRGIHMRRVQSEYITNTISY